MNWYRLSNESRSSEEELLRNALFDFSFSFVDMEVVLRLIRLHGESKKVKDILWKRRDFPLIIDRVRYLRDLYLEIDKEPEIPKIKGWKDGEHYSYILHCLNSFLGESDFLNRLELLNSIRVSLYSILEKDSDSQELVNEMEYVRGMSSKDRVFRNLDGFRYLVVHFRETLSYFEKFYKSLINNSKSIASAKQLYEASLDNGGEESFYDDYKEDLYKIVSYFDLFPEVKFEVTRLAGEMVELLRDGDRGSEINERLVKIEGLYKKLYEGIMDLS